MEVLPGDVPLPNRSVLKRSVSTASLPTPPRTHRRRKRGCSHGVHNSESNNLGDQDSELSSSDEGGAEFPRSDQRSHKKRRLSLSSGGDDNEEAFWLAGPKSEARCQRDLDQEHLSDTNKDEGVHADDFSSVVPLLYRKPLKRSHSEAGNGLASPPPSHRKPQPQALATLPVGVPESSSTAVLPVSQPVSPPKTPKKRTGPRNGFKSPEFPIISDSPDNPFYVVPGSPSPGEESQSPRVDSGSPQTPVTTHYEKPTVTYVFRGVRREYQNPLYNHKENRPLSPPPTSLLPIEHPDYSPDMTCRPTILFPDASKGKHPAYAKGESAVSVSTSKGLRRSPRKTRMVIGDSDDENERQRRSVGVERETLIMPRKLDFGLLKKAKAAVGKNDTF